MAFSFRIPRCSLGRAAAEGCRTPTMMKSGHILKGIASPLSGLVILSTTSEWSLRYNFHGKLVDNFIHKPDVTSLQDPFTSRPYKTSFYFYYCVPRKIRRGILPKKNVAFSFPDHLDVLPCSSRNAYSVQVFPGMSPCSPAVSQRASLRTTT